MPLSSIAEAIEEIRQGRMVILVDEDAPESDGFFFIAAEKVSAEAVNYMLHHGRGIVYLTLLDERIRELGIPLVPEENSLLSGLLCGASFTISLDGVHGVSAQGRAHTIRAAVADTTRHEDLVIPGHVQPLQARSGGVLARPGRTDASVDLAHLAGFKPAGAICQILAEDGSVARLAELKQLAEEQHLKIVSVADLIAHRLRNESLVRRVAEEEFPTIQGGMYRAIVGNSSSATRRTRLSLRSRWAIRSATETILRCCSSASCFSSASRATEPSSARIWQMAPAGLKPARCARSTDASVRPGRASTPPLRACSGCTWPGITRSSCLVVSATAARIVCARPCAETPCTPSRLIVNDAPQSRPDSKLFSSGTSGMPSSRMRSSSSVR